MTTTWWGLPGLLGAVRERLPVYAAVSGASYSVSYSGCIALDICPAQYALRRLMSRSQAGYRDLVLGAGWTEAVALAAAYVIAVIATPAGISGAVLLLPFQVSVLGTPSPAVTPTNLLYNVVATPGALYRYWRQGQTGGAAGPSPHRRNSARSHRRIDHPRRAAARPPRLRSGRRGRPDPARDLAGDHQASQVTG
jgi:hypothetical protein